MLAELELDPSQRTVVEAPAETRLFVTAAAGQGKTEVLLGRVEALVEEGLNPADEILVLSFSRAAVEAVRKRARKHDLDGLQIRTFDSFASQILMDEDELSGNTFPGFEARIRRAAQLISGEDIPNRVSSIRHLLIDEAQDLVGDRAELVNSMLLVLEYEVGFTVLGDPLQGIYDFQLDESHSDLTSGEFIQSLVDSFGAEHVQLAEHYRATSERTRELIEVGEKIRALGELEGSAVETAHQMLDDFRLETSSASLVLESGALSPPPGETTALLCSTNYEVLIASELLWENDYHHIIRRAAQEMSAAPWVCDIFSDLEDRTYSAAEIKDRLKNAFEDEANDYWLALKTAEGNFSAYDSLNVTLLSRRLRSRSIPLSLTVKDNAPLVVSTIHRAKGLEFDNIIYVQPEFGSPAAEENSDSVKQKYVALSRARSEIVSTKLPKNFLKYRERVSGRWLEKAFGKYGKYTSRMEFMNSDIEDQIPYSPEQENARVVQDNLVLDRLLGKVISGTLEYMPESGEVARYTLRTNDGQIVGRTSQSFGYALKNSFKFRNSRKWKWPPGFSGARVTSIECATGHPEDTKVTGLGSSGMWLVPRLTGLIRPSWK